MESLKNCHESDPISLNAKIEKRDPNPGDRQFPVMVRYAPPHLTKMEDLVWLPKGVFRKIIFENLWPRSLNECQVDERERVIQERKKTFLSYQKMCVSWYNAFHPLVCEERLNELDPGLLEIKRYHFPHTPWDSFMACLNEKAIDTRLKSYGTHRHRLQNEIKFNPTREILTGITYTSAGIVVVSAAEGVDRLWQVKEACCCEEEDSHFKWVLGIVIGIGIGWTGWKINQKYQEHTRWKERDVKYAGLDFQEFQTATAICQLDFSECILYGWFRDPVQAKTVMLWSALFEECRTPTHTNGGEKNPCVVVGKEVGRLFQKMQNVQN